MSRPSVVSCGPFTPRAAIGTLSLPSGHGCRTVVWVGFSRTSSTEMQGKKSPQVTLTRGTDFKKERMVEEETRHVCQSSAVPNTSDVWTYHDKEWALFRLFLLGPALCSGFSGGVSRPVGRPPPCTPTPGEKTRPRQAQQYKWWSGEGQMGQSQQRAGWGGVTGAGEDEGHVCRAPREGEVEASGRHAAGAVRVGPKGRGEDVDHWGRPGPREPSGGRPRRLWVAGRKETRTWGTVGRGGQRPHGGSNCRTFGCLGGRGGQPLSAHRQRIQTTGPIFGGVCSPRYPHSGSENCWRPRCLGIYVQRLHFLV